ncbi:hypothetical protein [Tichowtungia aerotolerans]|uniref:Uncharacterized protein n=1 Tax=Tichowtungia aerotolerans TaxID=2697043 RepID=A0A6P1M2M7_9BACT|nr:hypothetical protein [Tichowtungia aerotolerans]QHI68850.1 hypothetical protein GT409_05090 [Tichowtungia aerotolerans]
MRNRLKERVAAVVAVCFFSWAGSVMAVNYYDGTGDVSNGANWSDGAVSVPPTLGVITNTGNAWTGSNWNNMGVRQTGGYLYDAADNGLYLLNGAVYEIDDPRTDYASYTNLDVSGIFKIWTSTTAPTLRLLSGHVEMGSLHLITAPTIDIENGIFHVGSLTNVNPKANFNFLAGGTGVVVIDDMAGYAVGGIYINFESGNAGSFTLGGNIISAPPTSSSIAWLIANSRVSIDGVADTNISSYLITQNGDATTIAPNPYRDYETFIGQNDDSSAPVGALYVNANWADGSIPDGTTTGLIYKTQNVWFGTVAYDLAILQIDGTIVNGSEVALRGGSDGTSNTTTYVINDSDTDYASYTNLSLPTLTIWSHYSNPIDLSILSGHVDLDLLQLVAPGNGVISMKDGILHAGSITKGQSTVNMLAGGTGAIVFDSLDFAENSLETTLKLNFESGNQGSFTLGSISTNSSAAGTWEAMISNSRVSIDGVTSTSLSDFVIVSNGLSTTISLSSYYGYPKFIGQYANSENPSGGLTVDANWDGGVQPVGSRTGLLYTTANVWFGPIMSDLAVVQVGGTVYAAGEGDFGMRGGSDGTDYTSLYILDDPDTDYASYTNMNVPGTLTLWSQYDNSIQIDVLSGHAEAGTLKAVSGLTVSNRASKATISMKNGRFYVGTLDGGTVADERGWFEVNLDMLADGSGEIVFDTLNCTEIDGYLTGNFGINFETGNTGSITFGSKLTASGTESAAGIWAAMIANGQLSVDGVVETDSSLFTITQVGKASTIKLSDGSVQTPTEAYGSWISRFIVADSSMAADPDGDGQSNLAEYALYGDPSDPSTQGQGVTISVAEENGTNWFYYIHYERTDKTDAGLSYTPEAGSDLVNTNWSGSGLIEIGSGSGPVGFNAVTNRISMQDDAQQFMRVKIELQD